VAISLLGLALLVSALPALAKSRDKQLTETLRTYAATIRWGSIEQAESFVSPEYRALHPLTSLELERFKQVRITQYTDTAPVPVNDFEVRQTVEIGLVNVYTQEARTIVDRQIWIYDKENKVWLLHSGLPDITQRN
jgi:hypothetical protein